MKTLNFFNTDERTFLITFRNKSTNKKFIFQKGQELKHIIENYNTTAIQNIKEFNPAKNNFIKVSKADFLNCFSWNTETYLFLKNQSFFK